jgi:zinc transport system substrate-binding protein
VLKIKISFAKVLSVFAIGFLLVGCQASNSSEDESAANESSLSSTAETESSTVAESSSGSQKQTSRSHAHDEETEQIYAGYFEDSQVKERPLSDWEGDWQSVYPYLQDGTLDEVFSYKAEHEGDMTPEEYKEYYSEGYQTDVDRVVIKENTVAFFKDGEEYSGEYIDNGYEILTYNAGNRGVRYSFKLAEEVKGLPHYIQFSDHSIYPYEADHYHLYWGDDREELFDEVINWPTYYPSEMDGHDIAHEMMAH